MKKAPTKFTFKTIKATGPYRSFYRDSYDIKLGGIVCGSIFESQLGVYRVSIRVKDANSSGGWRNATLKARFNTVQAAKDALNESFDSITQAWEIHCDDGES